MTRRRAVFDASVLLRAVLDRSEEALAWIERARRRELDVLVPDLIWSEIANGLVVDVRIGSMGGHSAVEALDRLLALPVETQPLREVATAALATALERGVSPYDAFYLVLSEAADAMLVTADRKLAAATERAELIA